MVIKLVYRNFVSTKQQNNMNGQLTERFNNIAEAKKFISKVTNLWDNITLEINVGTTYKCDYTSFTVDNINNVIGKSISFWTNIFNAEKSEWKTVIITKNHIEYIRVNVYFNERN